MNKILRFLRKIFGVHSTYEEWPNALKFSHTGEPLATNCKVEATDEGVTIGGTLTEYGKNIYFLERRKR